MDSEVFFNFDKRDSKNKISQSKVHFKAQTPLTCPDTPRHSNLIQVKTGKEIASMHELLTSDQTKLKQPPQSSEPSSNEIAMSRASEDEVPSSYMVPCFEQVEPNKGKVPYVIPNMFGNSKPKIPVNLVNDGENTRVPSLSREDSVSSGTSVSGVEDEINRLALAKNKEEEQLLHLKQLDEHGVRLKQRIKFVRERFGYVFVKSLRPYISQTETSSVTYHH